MKRPTRILLLFLLQPLAFSLGADQPNIIFMLSDDQGWTETSVQMHPDIPNSKSEVVETSRDPEVMMRVVRVVRGESAVLY